MHLRVLACSYLNPTNPLPPLVREVAVMKSD